HHAHNTPHLLVHTLACNHPQPPIFSFHYPATTEIYTLSLHDALPIFTHAKLTKNVGTMRFNRTLRNSELCRNGFVGIALSNKTLDRKSTRLNSSHVKISYAVFCLKKKNIDPQASVPSSVQRAPLTRAR